MGKKKKISCVEKNNRHKDLVGSSSGQDGCHKDSK